ncbi:MAG: undecaprenyldiphospho-muramoylpentapeptide beta-N-acetylglucosaminyltransferase [Aquificaceae bacterium]|nr:undecaprenyldiphospho-muramoylpentapeptide beta-N-acetylglucosaminyltransferase [Aquificaceae bacterium]
MKIFVSGGGTGGHFFPAIAFMECVVEKGFSTFFVGSFRGIEYRLKDSIPADRTFVASHPFMGRGIKDKFIALYKNLVGGLEVSKRLSADGVSITFGGYASLPLGIASILRRKSLYLHEQNSIPSQTNRLLSNFAKSVFVTFEHSKNYFPKDKAIKTGLPVRKRLLEGLSLKVEEARRELSLENQLTLLVMGGSQGASFLNQLATQVFSKTQWQGIHITGEKDYQKLSDFYREKGLKVLCLPFTESMELVYRASTVAISRAGASSITELSLYGIPTLFVPYPYAVYDHQFYNAKEIENIGGGFLLKEGDANHEKVIELLGKLLQDRESFSQRIKTFANPLACNLILEYILKDRA